MFGDVLGNRASIHVASVQEGCFHSETLLFTFARCYCWLWCHSIWHPFCQFRSAALTVFPPYLLSTPILLPFVEGWSCASTAQAQTKPRCSNYRCRAQHRSAVGEVTSISVRPSTAGNLPTTSSFLCNLHRTF